MYSVYILRSNNRSYIGMTNNFLRRWMQHNKYISGGAKYTTSQNSYWEPLCIIDGFKTKSEAMQCEWKLKRVNGYYKRLQNLSILLERSEKWTKNSPKIKEQGLIIYVIEQYKHIFPFTTKELFWF